MSCLKIPTPSVFRGILKALAGISVCQHELSSSIPRSICVSNLFVCTQERKSKQKLATMRKIKSE